MTKYANIPDNPEVMDVFYYIVSAQSGIILTKEELQPTVNGMAARFEQKQSTISTKLQFLREHGMVKKDKWSYEPNWPVINKIFLKGVEEYVKLFFAAEIYSTNYKTTNLNRIIKFFNPNRIRSTITRYALGACEGYFKANSSLSGVVDIYFDGLAQCEISKNSAELYHIKEILNIDTMEKDLVLEVEKLKNNSHKESCLKCRGGMEFLGHEKVDFDNKNKIQTKVYGCLNDGSCLFIPVPATDFVYWADSNKKPKKVKVR